MRELKFRAWDDNGKEWVYQGSPDNETLQLFIFHWGDQELFQWTGLKDSKGVDIYEGDIVTDNYDENDVKYIWVIFNEYYAQFNVNKFGIRQSKMVVIGNIKQPL